MGLTDRGRAAVAAGVTLAAAGIALGFVELTRLGLAAAAAVVLAAVFVFVTRPQVEIESIEGATALQAGEGATFPLRLRPVSPRGSRTLRVDQPLPSTLGGGSAREIIPPLSAGQRFNLDLRMTFLRRGRHDIPACTVTREDPFGLASRSWHGGRHRTVTVYPRIHPLDPGGVRGIDDGGEGSARRFSVVPGEEHGSIRAYRPGDDLRRIHWPVTAHRGELMTRHDDRSTARRLLLALDPRLALPTSPEVLEWGVELLASLVDALDREGIAFDLLVAGHDPCPDRDEALATLALVPTTPRPPRFRTAVSDPFAEVLREQAETTGLVALVAGTTDPGATEDLLRTLPPGVRGIAVIVTPEQERAADLLTVAAEAGWTPVVATPADPHAAVWASAAGTGGRA